MHLATQKKGEVLLLLPILDLGHHPLSFMPSAVAARPLSQNYFEFLPLLRSQLFLDLLQRSDTAHVEICLREFRLLKFGLASTHVNRVFIQNLPEFYPRDQLTAQRRLRLAPGVCIKIYFGQEWNKVIKFLYESF